MTVGPLPPQTHPNLPRYHPPPGLRLPARPRLDPTTGRAVVYTNGVQVERWLLSLAQRAYPAAYGVTQHYAMLMLVRTQQNASGRPGPNVITGEYRASWRTEISGSPATGIIRARVFTEHPGARRLEFGFVGMDAIGRVYDQPPYPHLMPAWRQTTPEWVAAMSQIGGVTLR